MEGGERGEKEGEEKRKGREGEGEGKEGEGRGRTTLHTPCRKFLATPLVALTPDIRPQRLLIWLNCTDRDAFGEKT